MTQKIGHIAFKRINGKEPTIVFFSGFKSDMEGSKATYLEQVSKELGHAFVRFDYSGHGKSGGKFEEGTISQWKEDALRVIDNITEGKLILVGSSMGGWIMLLVALARRERVAGMVGIASAPDFTEELIWQQFTTEQKNEVMEKGFYTIPNCYPGEDSYPITKALIEDGRKHLLLNGELPIHCPARFIHGMKDADVPFQTSQRIAEKLQSDDVEIHLVKSGDHRMSAQENLELLKNQLLAIIART